MSRLMQLAITKRWSFLIAVMSLVFSTSAMADAPRPSYAVVVSSDTLLDPEWKKVVETLVAKHQAHILTYQGPVTESLVLLKQQFPRYACFVTPPDKATREFVAQVHQLTRKLDADPYTDCFWGILTGYDAANALQIAQETKPLVVHKTGAGTDVALEMCDSGVWFCELNQFRTVKKEPGQEPAAGKGPGDTTKSLVDLLNDYHADLFVTSGHATERDWQIGFRYRNGTFRCQNGQLFGLDTKGQKYPIHSENPKVYLPIGNCLMGHIDSRDAMALAFMNSAGVRQMMGYTVPTWYGYAGWGCLDYFVEQPGRFTFTEAVFANQHALVHRLQTLFPELVSLETEALGRPPKTVVIGEQARAAGLTAHDGQGLLYDRDVIAFYGDPAWEARMAPHPTAWD
ncbi:MAG: hypothetical protein JWM11_3674, partial [Planctomycetaceae bacterium]|nr:hypothetical protein [Planctomycetaceae bacterium]